MVDRFSYSSRWQEEARNYRKQHPGHCGSCGLPAKYCFHSDPTYRCEIGQLSSDGQIGEAMRLKRRWYLGALSQMLLEEVEALPMPPKDWMVELLSDWRQGKKALKTVWQRLLMEE